MAREADPRDPNRERLACEFRLLRFVPDAVRNEYVHIGVLVREPASSGAGARPARVEVRFTRDWRRVRCLDPGADTAVLEAMETELRRRLLEEPEGRLMALLEESLSLGVQMTEPKAYLAESLPAGVEELMRLYVDPPPREKLPRLSGRAAIQARMRRAFEQEGVWDLLRKRIAASDYTRPGDPLRIDAGYKPNGLVRMFHAVSLDPGSAAGPRAGSGSGSSAGVSAGIEMAKVLAFSSSALRAGVERVEKAELELTAIIEPLAGLGAPRTGISGAGSGDSGTYDAEAGEADPERLSLYRFGVETMEEHRIRVLTTSDLGRVAETARRELRV
jgi:hypothetical protein